MKIAFEDIRVSLGGQRILHGVNLAAEDGRITGIIGPNGCGKSTLLKTLFGIVPRESGRILLDGADAKKLSRRELAARVGYVGQDIPCVFDFSVRDVVEMAMYARRGLARRERNRIIDGALDSLGIGALAERSILTLSGGERKMVFLARSLAQGVDTIVLDEPTNHLDIRHQLFILDYLRRSGKTILIVLHDLRLAAHFCDELYLLRRGANCAHGAPMEVLTPENVRDAFGISGYAHSEADGSDFHIDFSRPISV